MGAVEANLFSKLRQLQYVEMFETRLPSLIVPTRSPRAVAVGFVAAEWAGIAIFLGTLRERGQQDHIER